ncbi:MAG TPA: hypothetical protein VH639_18950 [Bryobacteraceae bacterium]|jgi:hypothetical protein
MAKMFAIFAAIAAVAVAANPELSEVKSVYLLPMSGGLDQYLAVALTTGGVLKVVTDPKKADAVLTDRIGAGLQQSLRDLYASGEKKDDKSDDDYKPAMAPLSRGKGSIFLVNRGSQTVVWSTYALSKDSRADSLNRLAAKIAGQLQKDLKGK